MPSSKTSSQGPVLALTLLVLLAVVNFVMISRTHGVPSEILAALVGLPILTGVALFFLLRRPAAAEEAPPARSIPVMEPPKVAPPPKPTPAPALALLSSLQTEGRLVDFLQENITPYSDDQIGAAVRAIHEGCRKALVERMGFEPVLRGNEGDEITVPEGFDPSAIRLTGNITGHPPFRGTLRHHGWRAIKVKLAERPAGQDPNIIAPAEVEIP